MLLAKLCRECKRLQVLTCRPDGTPLAWTCDAWVSPDCAQVRADMEAVQEGLDDDLTLDQAARNAIWQESYADYQENEDRRRAAHRGVL